MSDASSRPATLGVSVTEVRNALRCPRVFTLGRTLGPRVSFPVGASSLGAPFHRIVGALASEVDRPPGSVAALAAGAHPEAVTRALSEWMLSLLVGELEAHDVFHSMPAEIDELADALREFARYLAGQLTGAPGAPAAALAEFLRDAERTVEAAVDLSDGNTVIVTGRIDALHMAPGRTVEVVEYKLTAEANDDLDRAQVALYRHLLRSDEGIDAAPVILRFLPALKVTRLEPAAADVLVASRLLPLLDQMPRWLAAPESAPPTSRSDLCPACPMRSPCLETYPTWLPSRDVPPSGAARPRPTPEGEVTPQRAVAPPAPPSDADLEGQAEAGLLQQRVLDALKRQRVVAEVVAAVVGPRLIRLEMRAARGSVTKLDASKADVEHRLAQHGTPLTFFSEGGRRFFRAERAKPRAVRLEHLLARERAWLEEQPGRFILGEGEKGDVVRGDLGDPTCAHLLVGGTTGSGKSVFLRALATSLAHFHPPAALQLTLVDPKRVSFQKLAASLGAHLAQPLLYDAEAAIVVLDHLAEEMDERYERFEALQVQSLGDYNDAVAPAQRLPRHVVVIDEFQDLTVQKRLSGPFLSVVQRLGAKARAAGIHLVLATQRPDRSVVPGVIKANLPGKVALKVQSAIDSRILLDRSGAEALLGRGDLLADLGSGAVRAQAPLV